MNLILGERLKIKCNFCLPEIMKKLDCKCDILRELREIDLIKDRQVELFVKKVCRYA